MLDWKSFKALSSDKKAYFSIACFVLKPRTSPACIFEILMEVLIKVLLKQNSYIVTNLNIIFEFIKDEKAPFDRNKIQV